MQCKKPRLAVRASIGERLESPFVEGDCRSINGNKTPYASLWLDAMKANTASRTAEYMALYRALESARPGGERLFSDPFAIHFLRPSLRTAAVLARVPYLSKFIAWYADRRAPGARTSAIARTRLIDDLVCYGLRDGVRQVVILGSGFDCRVYRLPQVRGVATFEVDHPATLAAKLSRLQGLIGQLPPSVRFVDIDFACQNLAEGLRGAGFVCEQPAVFVWEGVSNYLSSSAVDAVLRYVAVCARGSRLVFTYVHRRALDGSGRFPDAARILSNVAKLGEPWTFGLIPEELPPYLRERGLQLDRDDGAREYRRAYFGEAAEEMSGYDFYHVALASVPTRSS